MIKVMVQNQYFHFKDKGRDERRYHVVINQNVKDL